MGTAMEDLPVIDSTQSEDEAGMLDEHTFKAFNKMIENKRLSRYRSVLEKICSSMQVLQENDRKWKNKCRELASKIALDSLTVEETLQLSKQDKITIENLKKQNENSWKVVEETYQSEKQARETIQSLKQEITSLHEKAKEEETLQKSLDPKKLLKANEELQRENERLLREQALLENEIIDLKDTRKKFDGVKSKLLKQIEQGNRESQLCRFQNSGEVNRRRKVEKELFIVRNKLEKVTSLLEEREEVIEKSAKNETRLSKQLNQTVNDLENALQELEELTTLLKSTQHELDIQSLSLKEVTAECISKTRDVKIQDERISVLKKDLSSVKQQLHTILEKYNVLKSLGSENDIAALRTDNETLSKEIAATKQYSSQLSKQVEEVRHEKDNVAENLVLVTTEFELMGSNLVTQEHLRRSLSTQIHVLENESRAQLRTIDFLQRERRRCDTQIDDFQSQVVFLQEELKAYECLNYPKQLAEADKKIENIKELLEESRKEKRFYERKCREAMDNVKQMKETIQKQDQEIFNFEKLMELKIKELNTVEKVLQDTYQRAHQTRDILDQKESDYALSVREQKRLEERNNLFTRELDCIRKEMELILQKLEKTTEEKNILDTQLMRRNEEMKLLHERLGVQERNLNKGEMQYTQLEQDNFLLKTHVKSLVRKKTLMGQQVASAIKLRKELLQVHKHLTTQQTRAEALEDALRNPINIHRWRVLLGSDPGKYEMIQKIHVLQRLLITKTEELVQRSAEAQEKDKLLKEIKTQISRESKPDVEKKLLVCVSDLNGKNKALKTMESQVKMYESYIANYRAEVDRLNKELQELRIKVKKNNVS